VTALAKPETGRGAEMLAGSAAEVAEKIAALLGERRLVRA